MNAQSLSAIRVVSPTGEEVTGVGKYRYIAALAEGGMADVYLAVTQSAGFEKLVVIKQLRSSLAEDPSFVAMFMDEARLAARLNHPNVVQTLEVGTDEKTGLHFIAMEFLEGVAYVRFARKKERVPPLPLHLRILIETLRGLHYAHELRDFDGRELNVVHRDVSPQNVMLTWAGGVKVLDFGIAKAALAAEKRPEDFKGKLEYMAPEQACRDELDRRADVFSVGVMLHEALTRRRLFRKGDDKLALLVEGRLLKVLDVAPSTPPRLAEICEKAMAHHRDDRYATADAMADDLEEWLQETRQHISARDVGTYVAEMFESTREKIKGAIEEQLALFRQLASMPQQPIAMPIQRLPFTEFPREVMDTLPPNSFFPMGGETMRGLGQFSPYANLGTGPPPPDLAASLQVLPPPPNAPVHAKTSPTYPPAPLPGSAPPPPAARSNLPLILVSTALGGVLLAGGVGAITMARSKKPAPVAAVASTSSASAPAPDDSIDCTIRAMPPDAKITIDGQPIANPTIGKRPRDTGAHTIRIEAPGHEPREESVALDRNIFVSIDLHPLPPPPPPPPEPSAKPGAKWPPKRK